MTEKTDRDRIPNELIDQLLAGYEKILALYARGMKVGDIQGHLEELYGVDVVPDLSFPSVVDSLT